MSAVDNTKNILYFVFGVTILVLIVLFVSISDVDHEKFVHSFEENIEKDMSRYRRVYFSDTKFYFLTMDNEARRSHILNEFKEYSPIEVNPVAGISRYMSGATGFARMIDKGLRDQNNMKPFQPFIILEDDASKYRKFPEHVDIPIDADIVYLGLHGWGYGMTEPINIVYSEYVDKDLMRVKNLLALHGVMVCSAAGAAVIQRTMVESFYRDTPWDVPITHAQPFYNVYAFKTPLVYQDAKYGGKESATKIIAPKYWFRSMPSTYINKNGTSNLMIWTGNEKKIKHSNN